MARYDIYYPREHIAIELHHCREWDEDGGCYGSNPNHGMSWEDAREFVAKWHEEQAALIRQSEEPGE